MCCLVFEQVVSKLFLQSQHGDPRVWWDQEPEAGLHVSQRSSCQRDALLCRVFVGGPSEVGGGWHLGSLRRADLQLAHELRKKELCRWKQGQTTTW